MRASGIEKQMQIVSCVQLSEKDKKQILEINLRGLAFGSEVPSEM